MTSITMPSADRLVGASIRICRTRSMTEAQACELVMAIADALITDDDVSANGPSEWLLSVHQAAWRRLRLTQPHER